MGYQAVPAEAKAQNKVPFNQNNQFVFGLLSFNQNANIRYPFEISKLMSHHGVMRVELICWVHRKFL